MIARHRSHIRVVTLFSKISKLSLALTLCCATAGLASCSEQAPLPQPSRPSTSPATPPPGTNPAAKPAANPAGAPETNLAPAPEASPPATSPPGASGQAPAPGNTFTVGGIEFAVPSGWKPIQSTSSMRVATLQWTGQEGTVDAVWFTVQGSAQENINRWQRQMTASDPQNPGTTKTETVNGLSIMTYDAIGTYRGMNAMGAQADPMPNTRFIGMYIEGARTPVQIRITGPKQAVDRACETFMPMLAKIKRPN